jgi:hypothetical protein
MCQYQRQATDDPCGAKVPERHPATYQKVSRRIVDGVVTDTRAVYLCSNACCAERIKLTSHHQQQTPSSPPSPTGSPAP